MAVPLRRSVEEWREILSGAKVTVFEAIYGAIEVAMADFPDKMRVERDCIAQRLYSSFTTCLKQQRQTAKSADQPLSEGDHDQNQAGGLIKDEEIIHDDEESFVVNAVSGGGSNPARQGNNSSCSGGAAERPAPRIKIKCRFLEDQPMNIQKGTKQEEEDKKKKTEIIQLLIKTDQAVAVAANNSCAVNRRPPAGPAELANTKPRPPLALEKIKVQHTTRPDQVIIKRLESKNSAAAAVEASRTTSSRRNDDDGPSKLQKHFISDDTEFDKLLDRGLLPKKSYPILVRPNSISREEDDKKEERSKRKFKERYDEIESAKKAKRIQHLTAVNVREAADHNNLPTKKKGLDPSTTNAAAKKNKLTTAKDRICKVLHARR